MGRRRGQTYKTAARGEEHLTMTVANLNESQKTIFKTIKQNAEAAGTSVSNWNLTGKIGFTPLVTNAAPDVYYNYTAWAVLHVLSDGSNRLEIESESVVASR